MRRKLDEEHYRPRGTATATATSTPISHTKAGDFRRMPSEAVLAGPAPDWASLEVAEKSVNTHLR